jgi:hypothetical protein
VNETIFDFARRTIDDSSDSHLSSIIAKAKDFGVSAQHPYDHRGEHALYSAMDRLLQTIQSRRGQGESMMDGDYEEIKRMVEQDRYKVHERVGKDYAVVQKIGLTVFEYVLDHPQLRADVELMTILIKALSAEDNSHGDHINTIILFVQDRCWTVAHAVCAGLIPRELLSILKTNTHVDWNRLDGHLFAPVHYAVKSSNVDILKELLTIPPEQLDWNTLDGHGFTPVRHAVEGSLQDASKVDFLKELLKNPPHGLNVDTQDYKGLPPSYYAAKNGQKEILEILFEAGANLAWKGSENISVLHLHKDIVTLPLVALQECRRDVHATKLNKQFEVLQFLVKNISLESNGPSIFPFDFFAMDDIEAEKWFRPVMHLIQADEDNRALANDMLEFLLDRGLNANLSSSDGNFYLVDIAQKRSNEEAKQLLAARGGQSWKEHHPNLAWAGSWIGY